VGVNRFTVDDEEPYEPLRVDPTIEAEQRARLDRVRSERDQVAVDAALARIREAAAGTDNLLYPMRDALRARATVGEVSDALRDVWGVYTPTDAL
ncbi:MAG: methylmalonyl-CoA mutase family protein, partial [Candidatus Nanopelagicales bacterium]